MTIRELIGAVKLKIVYMWSNVEYFCIENGESDVQDWLNK